MVPAMFRKKVPLWVSLAILLLLIFYIKLSTFSAPGKSKVKNARPTPQFSIPDKEPGKAYLYFIAIGDQGTGKDGQKYVANLMNAKAQKDSLHFVLLLGDNFYSDGVSSVKDPQWQTKFVQIYNLPFLNVPFYATLGNHDHHRGNAPHQVEYSKYSQKWHMPSQYYTFTQKIDKQTTIDFIAMDTFPIVSKAASAEAQIRWLERVLQNSKAQWKVVFGHHPVFSFGSHGHEKEMIQKIRPIFEKYEVDAYICGHDHDRQYLTPVNGVHYIISGTGAKSRNTSYGPKTIFAATNLGFTWFRVSAEDFHVQFIDENGKIEFADTWSKSSVIKQPYIASEWKAKSAKKKGKKSKKRKKRKKH